MTGSQAAADGLASCQVQVIGEALIDIIVAGDGSVAEHLGGSPANVAIGLSRLGHPSELATWIGRDSRGERIAARMAEEGVRLAPQSRQAARTSTATAELDARGAATYQFDVRWELPAEAIGSSCPHVHTGSIAAVMDPGADAVLGALRTARSSATLSYDPNVRPSLMGSPPLARARVETLVALVDVVKASDEDLAWLYPNAAPADVLADWAARGPALCIATRGGDGVLVSTDTEQWQVPALSATVVDTVGAGDSFMAGLISGLLDRGLLGQSGAGQRLRSCGIEELGPAIDRAMRCAAITVSRAGANPPTRAEL